LNSTGQGTLALATPNFLSAKLIRRIQGADGRSPVARLMSVGVISDRYNASSRSDEITTSIGLQAKKQHRSCTS